jgi:hypothetical protein
MNTKEKKSLLLRLPSWGLSLLAALISVILVLIIAFLLSTFSILTNASGEKLIYIIWGIFIAIACFLICRKDPKSFWYVPILCNIISILPVLFEPAFWVSSLWILFCIGWGLSVAAATIGTLIGRHEAFRAKQ